MTVGIVGLGLIGGSLALDLAAAGEVLGWDADGGHRAAAAEAGITLAADVADLARRAELVVVAVPPAAVAEVVATVGSAAPGRVTTDVASVKGERALGAIPKNTVRWVGGHPMAGTERQGFAAARRGLLTGATWMLTPDATTDRAALADVLELVLAVGAAPVVVDADEHDRLVAAVSHVPHLLAFAQHATAVTRGGPLADLVAGPSFRDATRVAASDPAFWAEVASRNAEAIAEVLAELQAWLATAARLAGPDADVEALAAQLRSARRTHDRHDPDRATVSLAAPDAVARLRAVCATGYAVTALARTPAGAEVTVERR